MTGIGLYMNIVSRKVLRVHRHILLTVPEEALTSVYSKFKLHAFEEEDWGLYGALCEECRNVRDR